MIFQPCTCPPAGRGSRRRPPTSRPTCAPNSKNNNNNNSNNSNSNSSGKGRYMCAALRGNHLRASSS